MDTYKKGRILPDYDDCQTCILILRTLYILIKYSTMNIAEEWLALERDVLGRRPLISGTVDEVRAAYAQTSESLGALYPPASAYNVVDSK